MARYVEAYVLCSKKESQTKMGYRETKARQCQRIERNILHSAKRRRIQAHDENRSQKVGSSNASSKALQKTVKEQWRNPPQHSETQDEICMCCWCRRKHETKARRSWPQTSSRSHYCKRDECYNSLQSCAQNSSDASSMKIPDAKAAVEKECEKLEKNPTWQLTKVRNKKEVNKEIRAEKFHFLRHWWISVITRIRSWNLSIRKYKGRVVLRGDIVQDDSGSYAVFTELLPTTSQNDCSRSHGHKVKASRMRRTSSRRSIRLHPGQNGRCTEVIENSKVRIDILIRLPKHKWPKSLFN